MVPYPWRTCGTKDDGNVGYWYAREAPHLG
jgi:hypothetical protein